MLSLRSLLAVSALAASQVDARAVFCHYMVGSLTDGSGHAAQDINDAQAAGFDAFALNTNAPTASWATDALSQLFDAAQSAGFKLFFSMDAGAGGWAMSDWDSLFSTYLSHPAYYQAPNGKPFLSTFDSAGFQPSDWQGLRSSHDVYFVPDFDDTADYYTDSASWFSTWGSVVDGLYSWETAWPAPNAAAPANISTDADQFVMTGTSANSKTYMIPVSSLQYKHWPDNSQHYYRIGEVNLPQRMTEVLALGSDSSSTAPDFAELITWNDAGESHYIGNIWDESVAPWEYAYANSTSWSHAAWQPIVTSFIGAFKAGDTADKMAPPSGSGGVGAMWYRTILKDASCSSDPLGKPDGWQGAQDAVNWAIVLPSGDSGSVRTTSGGTVIDETPVSAGLNYKSVAGLATGGQKVELLDGSGNVVMTANSAIDVAADSTDVCNFNYQVAGFQ